MARKASLVLLIGMSLPCGRAAHAATASPCEGILARASSASDDRRINVMDLVRLRDIGQPESSLYRGISPLAVSPDGRNVALVVSRADPSTNQYCLALVVIGLSSGDAEVVDQGGEFIAPPFEIRGGIIGNGFPATITPVWSPDGRWIAYLKRVRGDTQVWKVRPNGSEASQVSAADFDVEALAWTAGGDRIVFSGYPGRRQAARTIEAQGLSGYLYDDRFVPDATNRPRQQPTPLESFTIDIATGEVRSASADEGGLLDQSAAKGRPADAKTFAVSKTGATAWTAPHNGSFYSPVELWTDDGHGRRSKCPDAACTGDMIGLWWSSDGDELRFLRPEGWANSQFALYRWRVGHGRPKRILVTDDVLMGCQSVHQQLLCARDSSLRPRRLELIDPRTGHSRLVFDPNPEFAKLPLGLVQRLRWRNEFGMECFGDLVLPRAYHPGDKLPLIVTQYLTKGFLRGGTGDEVPIQIFADRGYAVLSVHQPALYASIVADPTWKGRLDAEPTNTRDWRDRRSKASSVTAAIEQLIQRGLIDPKKIGLTGVSDGSTTAQYLLVNTKLFAAASVSACCMEPVSTMINGGTAWADQLASFGYPTPASDETGFWNRLSIALNARSMSTPLLLQLADEDYVLGLQTFTALRAFNQPAELFVFPGEHHIKWQPAHRLTVYERNLDWFDFWLRGIRRPDPAKAEQYERWESLRRRAVR